MSIEIEGELVHQGSSFIESQTRGEIDTQIATAKRYPRSIKAFRERAMSLATLDEETAASCFYSLPRGNKAIEGPSARLAEIVAASWGNLRAQANIIDMGKSFITARGVCWDLENNVAISVEVRRRITDKNNHRYNDDMIGVTSNAACSIALRNAVFKAVPMAMVKPIYEAARKVAIGDAQTLVSRRSKMVDHFGKMGVRPEQICQKVEKASIEDVTLDDLAILIGLCTAIKDGDTSVDDAFPSAEASKREAAGGKVDQLAERIKQSQQLLQPETTLPETTLPETTLPETTLPESTTPESTTPEVQHMASFFVACEDVLREAGLSPNEYEGHPDSPVGTIWVLPNGVQIRLSNDNPSTGTAKWIRDNKAFDVRTNELDAVQQTRDILGKCKARSSGSSNGHRRPGELPLEPIPFAPWETSPSLENSGEESTSYRVYRQSMAIAKTAQEIGGLLSAFKSSTDKLPHENDPAMALFRDRGLAIRHGSKPGF